jgi:hypothetical protein
VRFAHARRLRWGLACAPLLVALGAPHAANGAAAFSAECSPTTIRFPGTTAITCNLRVVTGGFPERFSVGAVLPRQGGSSGLEGTTLEQGGPPTLVGPGSFGFGMGTFPSVAACSSLQPGIHGAFGGSFRNDIEIPATSNSTLVFRFAARRAPWPGDSLAPTLDISTQMVEPGKTSTLPGPLRLTTPEPTVTGASGVRILFRTQPVTPVLGAPFSEAPSFEVGQEIEIRGNTNPPLKRQILTLLAGRSAQGPPHLKLLAKVQTNNRGKFHYDWEPKKPGRFELGIAFHSRSPRFADDFACSRVFSLTKPG